MKKIRLKFQVDPDWLKTKTYVKDPVRVTITLADSEFLEMVLGESGRRMAKAGFPFIFEKPLAKKLIDKGIAMAIGSWNPKILLKQKKRYIPSRVPDGGGFGGSY